jgi:hypothetical protein
MSQKYVTAGLWRQLKATHRSIQAYRSLQKHNTLFAKCNTIVSVSLRITQWCLVSTLTTFLTRVSGHAHRAGFRSVTWSSRSIDMRFPENLSESGRVTQAQECVPRCPQSSGIRSLPWHHSELKTPVYVLGEALCCALKSRCKLALSMRQDSQARQTLVNGKG